MDSGRIDFFQHAPESINSDSAESSCSGSDEDSIFTPWLEYVDDCGELFYIEHDVSCASESTDIKTDNKFLESSNKIKYKMNPAEKFKKWIKKHRSTQKLTNIPKSSTHINSFHSNKAICPENVQSLQMKKSSSLLKVKSIYIDVQPTRRNLGRRITLSEELLGIELCAHDNVQHLGGLEIVKFQPHPEFDDLRKGDTLIAVNDEHVFIHNINQVLRQLILPSKVKLTVESSLNERFTDVLSIYYNTVEYLLGDLNAISKAKSLCNHVPHGTFFFMLESNLMENKDVLYHYQNSSKSLFELKGLFITLCHMISECATPPILSCCLTVEGQLLHVGLHREVNELFILVLPAMFATIWEVQHFTANIIDLIKFQFLSLQMAFTGASNEEKLDRLFTIFFKHHVGDFNPECKHITPHLLEVLPSVHWLPLPTHLKTEIDEILSELESADFDISSPGFYENQRWFNNLGSCLFFKGYLLSSHLLKADLLNFNLFLHHNKLLHITNSQSVPEIIIWKEVFPTHLKDTLQSDLDYRPINGRCFMLAIAMNKVIISVLLEAGGCALKAKEEIFPNPFYIEEVQNTLLILYDCGIMSTIEKILDINLPPVATSKTFTKESSKIAISSIFSNAANIKNFDSTGNEGISVSMTENTEEYDTQPHELFSYIDTEDNRSNVESSDSDSNEDLCYCDKDSKDCSTSAGSTTESPESTEYSFQEKDISSTDLSGPIFGYDNCKKVTKLLPGYKNTLFHYLHMDPVEGIYLTPLQNTHESIEEFELQEVISIFQRSCLSMRTLFAKSLRNKDLIKLTPGTKYGINKFIRCAYEQGLLFYYTARNTSKSRLNENMRFWIIGRLYFMPEPREIYVCYHDSVHQDTVEIAFRLGFGLSF